MTKAAFAPGQHVVALLPATSNMLLVAVNKIE